MAGLRKLTTHQPQSPSRPNSVSAHDQRDRKTWDAHGSRPATGLRSSPLSASRSFPYENKTHPPVVPHLRRARPRAPLRLRIRARRRLRRASSFVDQSSGREQSEVTPIGLPQTQMPASETHVSRISLAHFESSLRSKSLNSWKSTQWSRPHPGQSTMPSTSRHPRRTAERVSREVFMMIAQGYILKCWSIPPNSCVK